MKLYATITSERATKGQGGKDLMIEILGEKKEVVARIKVTQPPYMQYLIEVFPVVYPDKLMLDVKGHGYKLKKSSKWCPVCNRILPHGEDEACELNKGEKQKGERYCASCDEDVTPTKFGTCPHCNSLFTK